MRTNNFRMLLLLPLLLGPLPHGELRAQEDIFSAENYLHSYWDVSSGLPTGDVRPLVQTPDGYVWIGAAEGLLRFDGQTFTQFNRANTPEMSAQSVRSLVLDRKGRLWIGFFAGGVLTYADGRFEKPKGGEAIEHLEVLSLVADSADGIYACTGRGVFRIKDGVGEYMAGLQEQILNGAATKEGALFFIGKSIYRWKEGRITSLIPIDPRYDSPLHISAEPGDRILLGVRDGLLRLHLSPGGEVASRESFPGPYVWSAVSIGESAYLVGTRDAGVFTLTRKGAARPRGFDVLGNAAQQVRTVMVDRDGGIWLATSGGLHRFRKSAIRVITPASGLPVGFSSGLFRSSDDNFWVSAMKGGTYRIPRSGDPRAVVPLHLPWFRTPAIYESRNGDLWFGGHPWGLAVRRRGTTAPVPVRYDTSNGTVHSIAEDQGGTLWVGTRAALLRWRNGKLSEHPSAPRASISFIRNIQAAEDGALWFIAQGKVRRLFNDSLSTFAPTSSHGYFPAIGLYVDTGAVWIGTYGSGVYLVRGDSIVDVERVTSRLGPRVLSILEDNAGNLWVNAERSLQRVNKRELLQALASPDGRAKVQVFDHNDGLQSVEFNHVSKNSSQRLPDGKLLYSSLAGIVLVDPSIVPPSPPPPSVLIESIIADGTLHAPVDGLQIPPGTRRLEIRYTALEFDAPSRVRFRVFLEGFDPRPAEREGMTRVVSYTNPAAGEYTFTVAATFNGEDWSAAPATTTFEVGRFYYETWWFRLSVLGLIIAGLWGAYEYRTRRMRARNRALEKEITQRREAEAALRTSEARAQELVREVQASLQEKTVMLKEIHHRVKNNMQVVSSLISLQLDRTADLPTREALGESRERIRSMALVHEALYHTDSLASIGFRKYLEKLVHQINLSHGRANLHVTFEGNDVPLPIDQAIPAGLLMNELVSNTFKHAFPDGRSGNITVSLKDCGGDEVELSVRDDGIGLPPGFDIRKAATLGLQLVVTLTEQLDGGFRVGDGPGTAICIHFRRQ